MKRVLFAIIALSVVACQSVPVERKFPGAVPDLLVACPDLDMVPAGTTKLSAILDTVTTNYNKYNDCRATVAGWIEWYNTQKQIFESVK